ncbi:MAG: hypothetical protein IT383_18210 [Deltaproteobacteria bacterium]|nr:hypothetical protein [Deltaproteobacteria bacterium]
MRCTLALTLVLVAGPALGQVDPSDEGATPAPARAPPPAPVPAPVDDEERALAGLRVFEARLSAGETLSAPETATLVTAATSNHVNVRALAVAVLAWLDPPTAAPVLLGADARRGITDPEPRVRAVATQSLLALARRLPEETRRATVAAALLLLDDPADEVACAAAELALAVAPSAVVEAVRVRAPAVDDVRYACFARIGGLPIRAIVVPDLPRAAAPEEGEAPQPAPLPPPPPDGRWVAVAALGSAGLLAGALVPTTIVPGRDVMLYDDDRTVVTREELSVLTQAAAGLAGAAALGGGAYAMAGAMADAGHPLTVDEAGVIALGTGALGLVGAGVPVALGLRGGLPSGITAAGVATGALGTAAMVAFADVDKNDEALALSMAGLGAMGGGLGVFAMVPVGVDAVGDVDRTTFGLATAAATAGAIGGAGLALGPFVDVAPGRSFALLAGGLVVGGLFTSVAFLAVPNIDVKSRIACGIGLGGELIGVTAALFVPDAWLGVGKE